MGKLFEPKTEAINNKITAFGKRKYGIINPWIGIHDIHVENRTVYASDKTTVTWSNWDANEPNNENDGEDCVHLYTYDHAADLDNNCASPNKGDGMCDDGNNNKQCGWDGGDCCGVGDNVWQYHYCSVCECLEHEQPSRWNDNTCNEYRTFICEKDSAG